MSCLLCDSVYHFTHNCDKYESDESRQEALVAKNRCPNCLSQGSKNHDVKKWNGCRSKNNKKCYMCFSREHLTIFCPDRKTLPNMIVPAIDEDLHKRFFQLFRGYHLEEYFLALISQEMFDKLNSRPKEHPLLRGIPRVTKHSIQFFDSLKNESHAKWICPELGTKFYVTNEVNLNGVDIYSQIYEDILDQCNDNFIYFKAKKVVLKDCEFNVETFLMFLSHYTKVLECHRMYTDENVKFVDIVQLIPNIDELILKSTFVLTDHLWADHLLRCKNTNSFSKLEIQIHGCKFNVESLATFIKTKCVPDVQMKLKIVKFLEKDNESDDNKNYEVDNNAHNGHSDNDAFEYKQDRTEQWNEKQLLDELLKYFEFEEGRHPILTVVEKDIYNDIEYRPFASFTKLRNL